jgi:hypothetical protein
VGAEYVYRHSSVNRDAFPLEKFPRTLPRRANGDIVCTAPGEQPLWQLGREIQYDVKLADDDEGADFGV